MAKVTREVSYIVAARDRLGAPITWATRKTYDEAAWKAEDYARRFPTSRPFYVVEHVQIMETVATFR